MKESHARRKSGSRSPKRFSGDGSAPPRFRFGFPVISFSWRVLGCGERSEPHLFMPSTRESAKRKFLLIFRYKMLVFFMNILSANLLLVEKIFTIREGR